MVHFVDCQQVLKLSTDSSDAGDKHIAFGDLDDMIAALSSAAQEEIDKSKVQHKVLYSVWYPFHS